MIIYAPSFLTAQPCFWQALPKVMFPERELELKATGRARYVHEGVAFSHFCCVEWALIPTVGFRCERCLSRGLKAQVDESEVAADGGIVSGMR